MMTQYPGLKLAAATALVLSAFVGCNSNEGVEAVTASIGEPPSTAPERLVMPPAGTKTPSDPLHPIVRFHTSGGDVVVKLDAEKAPITVKNFLWYIGNGHYEGTIFHQVMEGYVVLGGGYLPDMVEKQSHFTIRNEAYNQLKNTRGTIAMARQPEVIDSSTCQFFFNLSDNPKLDHRSRDSADEFGYCVFGEVIEGLNVLEEISRSPTSSKGDFAALPIDPITIKSVEPVY